MVFGVGTDIVDVARVDGLIRRHGEKFLGRIFTAEEIAYCSSMARAGEHFAGRFAAKEAVLKALGSGLFSGPMLTEISVRRDPSGAPVVNLTGSAERRARSLGISRIRISISHTATVALAVAIAETDEG
jgi:holo-[acyl-carrier protein] synthase